MSFEEIAKILVDYGALIGFGCYLVWKDLKFTEKLNDVIVLMNSNIEKMEELMEKIVNKE